MSLHLARWSYSENTTVFVAWFEQRDTQVALSRVSLRSTRATPKPDIHEVRA
nr:hypothetical protein [uncultured Pseudomonas sp.]